jgi:MoxR-like ATPase
VTSEFTDVRTTSDGQLDLAEVVETAAQIARSVESVVEGKPEVVHLALIVLFAQGHLLLEDVPGVGKTTLAKTLARSLDCTMRRIQFTPDLLPSDVTGVSIFNQLTHQFEFRPGAVFANIVLGDEINRASPKTQSALLECMEEQQVTVDGVTYPLSWPFIVIATQNPIDMEGTYPLPEAQRDRFMARVSMGYPDREAEMAMLDGQASSHPLDAITPVASAVTVSSLIRAVQGVHVSAAIRKYAVEISQATRQHRDVRLGASPRATLHIIKAAKSAAALAARDYVLPDDIQQLAGPVLAHRLILTADAHIAGRTSETVIAEILSRTPVAG